MWTPPPQQPIQVKNESFNKTLKSIFSKQNALFCFHNNSACAWKQFALIYSFICYLYHIQSASHLNMEFSLNKKVLHLCLFSPTVHIITIIGYFIMIYLCIHGHVSIWHSACVYFCTRYILITKICIWQAKWGHFWKVKTFWLLLTTSKAGLRVKTCFLVWNYSWV